MSPKELLYLEDTLAHITFLKTLCNGSAKQLSDKKMQTLVQALSNDLESNFKKVYKCVGGAK